MKVLIAGQGKSGPTALYYVLSQAVEHRKSLHHVTQRARLDDQDALEVSFSQVR